MVPVTNEGGVSQTMTERRTVITISGDLGSGKSTLRRLLARKLDYREFSAGELQRQMAAERGMTSLEFNEHSEQHPEMDGVIDTEVQRLAEGASKLIIDSRLAWHFVTEAFRIHLTVHPLEGARRVHGSQRGAVEGYRDFEDALDGIRKRRLSEDARYLALYGVDTTDLRNYDFVADTTVSRPEATAEAACSMMERWLRGETCTRLWLSPRGVYPTKDLLQIASVEPLAADMRANGFREEGAVDVLRADESYLILDGHLRTAAAIAAKIALMPCSLVAWNDHRLPGSSSTAREYALANCTRPRLEAWERANHFRFRYYPSFLT